jgi:CSLREA domain-containing protein
MCHRMQLRVVGWVTVSLLFASTAGAAVFTVSRTTDGADGTCDADCSLREAVIAANAPNGVSDTIVIPAGTYTLTLSGAAGVDDEDATIGDLEIDTQAGGGLTIQGAGSAVTTIDATGLGHRIFHIPPSFNAVAVSISGMTLRGGNLAGFSTPGCALRAASRFVTSISLTDVVITSCTAGQVSIHSLAPLVVNQCSIHDNASGGIGLSTDPSTNGTNKNSTITDSTIARNDGIAVSAIRSVASKQHSFNLTNVTLSDNDRAIPAVSTIGAITTTTNAVLRNVTIANDHGRGISAIYDFFGTPTVQVQNTILSGNARGDVLGYGQDDAAVLPVSLGNNVVSDGGAGAFSQASDRIRTNPLLTTLADHGGPTETHDLTFGSAAIDRAAPAGCPAMDQRGITRPLDGDGNGTPICDIGAVEFIPPACSNGEDDDGDAYIDFPADRGCSSAADDSERAAPGSRFACDDGIDNDGDQLIDYPEDPGCPFSYATIENPQCDDGVDNDQNGFTDFADAKCQPSWPYWEKRPCGLGVELALVLPLLALGAHRSHRARVATGRAGR